MIVLGLAFLVLVAALAVVEGAALRREYARREPDDITQHRLRSEALARATARVNHPTNRRPR